MVAAARKHEGPLEAETKSESGRAAELAMTGRWVGVDRQFNVNSDVWELQWVDTASAATQREYRNLVARWFRTGAVRADFNAFARSRECVVLPQPSTPSTTTNTPGYLRGAGRLIVRSKRYYPPRRPRCR